MNTKKLFGYGIFAVIMAFAALSFAGCENPAGTGGKDLTGNVSITYDLTKTTVTTGMELTADYTGDENVSYQWNKDGQAIGGATNKKYTPNEAGNYTVTVSAAGYNSKTSNPIIVAAVITYTIEQTGGEDGEADSTGIKFTFNASIDDMGLTADDITVGGKAEKAAEATFTGSGTSWTLAITVNGAGTATVTITKAGIDAATRYVTVYKEGEFAPITYTAVQTGGSAGTADSTGIVFTFNKPVSDLDADDITVTDGTGSVIKGNLSGSDTTWTLGITVNAAGDVSVKITKAGIDDVTQTVAVYKAVQIRPTDIDYDVNQTGGSDGYVSSTGLVFYFHAPIDSLGLTADDITVSGAAEKAPNATLTRDENSWTLSPITVNSAGLATVHINKSGIDAAQKSVVVYKAGEAAPEYWSITWKLNGGEEGTGAYPTQIIRGTVLAKPSPDPTKADHEFAGWYPNANSWSDTMSTTPYDFASPVNGNLTLHAKWWSATDLAPGGETNPLPLTADEWKNGSIATSGDSGAVWYSFEVTSGQEYNVWWNERDSNGDGTKSADVTVYAYYSNGTEFFGNGYGAPTAWETAKTFTANSTGTVKVKVTSDYYTGTFAIAYSESETRPVNNSPGLEDNPILLTVNVWEDGEGGTVWYSFEVTNGQTYYVWLNDSDASQGKTLDAKYSAYYSSGTSIFTDQDNGWNDNEYSTGRKTFTANSTGTVKVKVEPRSSGYSGTFAVAYTTVSARPVSAGDTPRTLSVITANGSITALTTQLTLTFDEDFGYNGLSANDIFLSGVPGVVKGNLSNTGAVYTLPISGFTESGNLTVSVAKTGYNISGSPQTVPVYYVLTPVTFSSLTANGSETQTATQLTLTFSAAITGLTANDITLSGMTGVNKGSLSGSGTTYTLNISGVTQNGTLTVEVSRYGYTITESSLIVVVYYAAPVTFSNNISANGPTTTQLTLNFSAAIAGLNADDITLSGNVSSGIVKGSISGSGPSYTLGISGVTAGGTLTVAVSKAGYNISDPPRNVTIYYNNSSPGTEGNPYPLTAGIWANGNTGLMFGNDVWYSFNVTSGQTYYVWFNFEQSYGGDGTKSLPGIASAYYGSSSGANIFNGVDRAWSSPRSFTASSTSTVKVKVARSNSSYNGTFAVVYNTASSPRPDPSVTLNSITPNGSAATTTTQLTLTFSEAIAGLSAADITLSGVNGVSKGILTGTGPSYFLPITVTTGGGDLNVSVAKTGFTIGGSPQTVTIFYHSTTPTFISVTANGSTTEATSQLTLTFSSALTGLNANDITLSGVSVTKGTLSGTGPVYTLGISNVASNGGTLSVAAAKTGYTISGSPQTVQIYAPTAVNLGVGHNGTQGPIGYASRGTSELTLTFDQAIPGLTAADITLSGVDGVDKGTLTGTGPAYTLPISGFNIGGTLTVTVAKAGYSIPVRTVDILAPRTLVSVTANGSTTQTTTQLTLTFSAAIPGLAAADIDIGLLPAGMTITKGYLSGTGPSYTLPISGFTQSADADSNTAGGIRVSATKTNFAIIDNSKVVPIYYKTNVAFNSVTANGQSDSDLRTTQLTLTFDRAITGLTAADITLSGVSGVSKGTLTGTGPSYILPISGFTQGGTLSVKVAKTDYLIDGSLDTTGSTKTVTIYYRGTESSPIALFANAWADYTVTSGTAAVWYTINISANGTYSLWWNDQKEGDSTKTLDVKVTVYSSTGTAMLSNVDSGWTNRQAFSAANPVKIKVEPFTTGGTGSFSLVYSTGTTRPTTP